MRSRTVILAQFPWSADHGLTATAVAQSRRLFGANHLTPPRREPIWRNFLEKFDEPIIKILLGAALLSMVVDLCKAQPIVGGVGLGFVLVLVTAVWLLGKTRWIPGILLVSAVTLFGAGLVNGHVLIEGLAVMVAVILATGVAFVSEYKSQREFDILNANRDSIRAKVLRDGALATIAMEDVVVGDVLLLEMGDEIPADGRLLKATELYVDQSLMTGESEPVRKHVLLEENGDGPDKLDCVYRGTQVVDGVGTMIVAEVGDETYLGRIARQLTDSGEKESLPEESSQRVQRKLIIDRQLTPLQLKLKNLADLISKIGYAAALLIFLAQLVRGILVHEIYVPHDWPQVTAVFGELIGYFVTMVIIIVVAVPEGLPMSVTISLALAMREMTRANCLIRQLVACETIGSATVICSDKTGTLTQNKMRVEMIACAEKNLEWIVLNAAVNSTANFEEKDGQLIALGNSTEAALLCWLRERGFDHARLRAEYEPLYQLHFSSERKRMTSVVCGPPHAPAPLVTLVKGSPEWVLEHCQRFRAADGTVQPLSDEKRGDIQQRIDEAARRAMRILAFAYGPLPTSTPADPDALHDLRDRLEDDLIYVGFAAIRDPLRDDVKEAVAECRRAGIEVKMVTGDSVETARAIGREIGLIADDNQSTVLTSGRFNELDDERVKQLLPGLRILARARPLDKLRLVRLLQELGEVVAVTGDGTNDAPALKKADVGLAMGVAGTEVAKEASKIVLLDDAFSTIVRAVRWGRSRYENIQRFLQFQLTINLSALTITFLGILVFNVKAPFTVLQLLWINVIMDTLASIALCSEPPGEDVLDKPPKRRDENILTPAMLRTIFTTGGFFVIVMLALLLLMKGDPDAPGLFAGGGPWSVEAAGNRLALELSDLAYRDGNWFIGQDFPDSGLRGQEASVQFTVFQVSLFFSIYVFFQVWNQINCRSLSADKSGLAGILKNPTFLAVACFVAVGQIIIITVGGKVFQVEPLGPWVWAGVIGFTGSVLIFAELMRWLGRLWVAWRKPGC